MNLKADKTLSLKGRVYRRRVGAFLSTKLTTTDTVFVRAGSGSSPSLKIGLGLGLLLNKQKARARTGLFLYKKSPTGSKFEAINSIFLQHLLPPSSTILLLKNDSLYPMKVIFCNLTGPS